MKGATKLTATASAKGTKATATINRVAELAARHLFGESIARPLSFLIGLGILSSISAYLLTGPRVTFAMARDGLFPRFAARVHAKRRTPVAAILTQAAVSLALLWGAELLAGGTEAFEKLLR